MKDVFSFILKYLAAVFSKENHAAQFFKIFVTFFQVLGSFTMFSVEWPEGLTKMISWVKSIRLDFIQLPGISCLWHGISFRSSLMAYTIGPLGVLGALLTPVVVSFLLRQMTKDPPRWNRTLDSFWTNTMFFFFIIYPSVSIAVMNSFDCDVQLGLLKTDYRELCPSFQSFTGMYSTFFFFLYPIGIPCLIIAVLRKEGVEHVVKQRLVLAEFDAMIALYVRTSCSLSALRFARLIGETGDDLDEFNRQAHFAFRNLLKRQNVKGASVLIIEHLEQGAVNMGVRSPFSAS